jgi:hypothetical protein
VEAEEEAGDGGKAETTTTVESHRVVEADGAYEVKEEEEEGQQGVCVCVCVSRGGGECKHTVCL